MLVCGQWTPPSHSRLVRRGGGGGSKGARRRRRRRAQGPAPDQRTFLRQSSIFEIGMGGICAFSKEGSRPLSRGLFICSSRACLVIIS